MAAALIAIGVALGVPEPVRAQQTCTPTTASDWMTNALARNPLVQDIRPHDCDTVQQSPPDFRWPDVIASGGYNLTLTYPDGHTRTLSTTQNWRNWDEVLPPGTYKWTVGYSGGAASATRSFIVDAGSLPFLVPDTATLTNTVAAKPHPRSLPDAAAISAIQSQRAGAISQLLNEVAGHFNMPLPSQGGSADDAFTYSKYALASIAACVLSNRQASYCSDAVRRVVNLASWDPVGPTSYYAYGSDMAGRYLTWTIALGYDWLYPMLGASQRAQILDSAATRTAQLYNDLIGTRSRLANFPRDSHGNQALYYLAIASTLLVGDIPIATTTWFPNSVPLALNALNPWGGDEGGFANGATQGNWDVGELNPIWYEFRIATGIDPGKKAWLRNWGRYFSYFTPPGMMGGTTVFGDGYELNEAEHQARYGKAYTYFAPTALGRWHMSRLNAEDPTRFEYIMAPPADFSGAQPFPAGTPNSLYLKSIGQVAMHSDLSDLNRISVYFKSSPAPYGAFNHSHADQNSFAINAGGQRLAIESGYYDDYKTQHWWNWYHQTRSKNAITYDGGKGQIFLDANGVMGYGRVGSFTGTAGYDVAMGDATSAYGGVLSLAQRSLIYLRPNLIVVYDNVAAPAAHTWEWNIHASSQIASSSDTTAMIQAGNQKMCVTMLAAPATTRFTQSSEFTSNPLGSNWAPQWHGKFVSGSQTSAEFVALMNVGCLPVSASALKNGGVWTVAVGNATITIGGGAISVTGAGTSTTTGSGTTGTGTTGTTGTTGAGTTGTPAAPPYAGTSFSGTPIALPGNFEAENFDRGGEGVAYRDTTRGNLGGQYRTGEDVDIVASCDTAGGYVVNNLATGEWLNYTVNAATNGSYTFQLRASNNYASGAPAFHVEVDGASTPSVPVPRTGGWCNFQWVPAPAVNLTAGRHVVKIVSDQQYFNLNSVAVTATGAAPTPTPYLSTYAGKPFTGTPIAVPATFQAANYDIGGQDVAYNDTTSTNLGGQFRTSEAVDITASCDPAPTSAYAVNNFASGEWMNYTISVATAGNYLVQLRASNNYSSAVAFHVEVDGAPVGGPVLVPRTGAWCSFQPVATPTFQLSAGTHVLRIVSDQAYFNLETINVIRSQ